MARQIVQCTCGTKSGVPEGAKQSQKPSCVHCGATLDLSKMKTKGNPPAKRKQEYDLLRVE